jgi:endo-1,4-beta-xylanase
MTTPHALTRRSVLGLAMALPAIGHAATRPVTQSLGEAAAVAGIIFGASATSNVLNDPAYAALHSAHSRLLVTDLALKFDYLRPSEDIFDFAQADALLAFARSQAIGFRGAAMIWNDWPAAWLKGKSSSELTRIFDEHIDVVGSRYAGAMQSWDVVNEPFWPDAGEPGGYRTGPWYGAMGQDYIPRAFERVARVDPKAKLVLNEAFCEQNDALGKAVRSHMLPLIDKLQDRGVKLDAIGLQAHIRPGLPFDIDAFLRFLDEIAARKLDIYLTEFDIEDNTLPFDIARRDELVAGWTARFLNPVLENRKVKAVITWQLADRHSWYRDPAVADARGYSFSARPLPFDDGYNDKPMAQALRTTFLAAPKRD